MEQTPQADTPSTIETMEIPPEPEPYPSAAAAWSVVALLTLAYVFSFIDRQILSLMVAPIRHDLDITDFQMSLLMGASFAVFYAFFGIPLGRLADTAQPPAADRRRRRSLERADRRLRADKEVLATGPHADGGGRR